MGAQVSKALCVVKDAAIKTLQVVKDTAVQMFHVAKDAAITTYHTNKDDAIHTLRVVKHVVIQVLWIAGPMVIAAVVPGAATAIALYKIVTSGYDIYENGLNWKNGAGVMIGVMCLAAPFLLPAAAQLVGFGEFGPRAGSLASWVQATYYGAAVSAGSFFAVCQSFAMKC